MIQAYWARFLQHCSLKTRQMRISWLRRYFQSIATRRTLATRGFLQAIYPIHHGSANIDFSQVVWKKLATPRVCKFYSWTSFLSGTPIEDSIPPLTVSANSTLHNTFTEAKFLARLEHTTLSNQTHLLWQQHTLFEIRTELLQSHPKHYEKRLLDAGIKAQRSRQEISAHTELQPKTAHARLLSAAL